ncbi:BspA family leucine-rich repeat surface protein [Methylovulum psychrotolerans]|uniref:RelA/SpoT domain-containing protein n=1 Tax=Methylovulum psychrotolerans TaxID=1704499 RepID=UPI001BFF2982|nr:RelA/SpoT domain-containing protein [Methylovulum psychrotolerans]MBT9099106.1 BspA family leucine-rich repeat surface protein [Methylovulum psychrotolerans]
MIQNITHQDFLRQNLISDDTWNKSQCDWEILKSIGIDYEKHREEYNNAANIFAQSIQKFHKVHSVRWRVKDAEHLLEKIVRKCAKQEEKYKNISCDNYREIVTDLIGIRALHLFKEDCFEIDGDLKNIGSTIEDPIVYLREGDSDEKFISYGFIKKYHPAGYRSVHYVFSTSILNQQFVIELQVRTIFEEGWSEIDHRVRYPNFSDDQLVSYFLGIFNRMAGTADEMGSFVIGLTNAHQEHQSQLNEYKAQLDKITTEKEQTLLAMDETIAKLDNTKSEEKSEIVTELKNEFEKLKSTEILGDTLKKLVFNDPLEKYREDLNRISSVQNSFNKLLAFNDPLEKYREDLNRISSVQNSFNKLLAFNDPLEKYREDLNRISSVQNSFNKLLTVNDPLEKYRKDLNHLSSIQNAIDKLKFNDPFKKE